jgi:hypothetical protein
MNTVVQLKINRILFDILDALKELLIMLKLVFESFVAQCAGMMLDEETPNLRIHYQQTE